MKSPFDQNMAPTDIRRIVATGVTKPLSNYVHAAVFGGLVYVSGVQGFLPGTFDFPEGGAGPQAARALKNLAIILDQADSGLDRVLKLTILLVEMVDFPYVNEAIDVAFQTHLPARSTLAVKELPRGARVIFDVTAACRVAPLRA